MQTSRTSVPLRRWLPNETLFSLCSRNHVFFCHTSPQETCERLFSSPRQGSQHDLPSNLQALETNTQGILGTADEIARRTILPFFAPFRSQERMQAAMTAMLGPSIGSLKYQLGLITGRFGAEHPLKACPQCMVEDITNLGIAYWHLDHQYPGVIVCTLHGIQLWESTLKRMWAGRFFWCLPDRQELVAPMNDLSKALIPALQMANACSRLAELGFTRWFDPLRLRQVYVSAIRGDAERRRQGTSLPAAAVDSFASFVAELRAFRPFQALPATQHEMEIYLQRLMRNSRTIGHPLRHLVAIVWLFESLEGFLQAYDAVDSEGAEEPQPSQSAGWDIVGPGQPIMQKGHRPRPKTLKPPIRRKALRLLAKGTDKHSVCRHIGVTISAINKLLRAEPAVNQAWKVAFAERTCARHRARWCTCAKTHPSDSPQQLRQSIPDTYAWLYRNDKNWLVEQTARIPSGREGNHSQVDWSSRDQQLAQLVRAKLTAAYGSLIDLHMHRSEIYTLAPELPTALKKAERYPLTRALLASLIRR